MVGGLQFFMLGLFTAILLLFLTENNTGASIRAGVNNIELIEISSFFANVVNHSGYSNLYSFLNLTFSIHPYTLARLTETG